MSGISVYDRGPDFIAKLTADWASGKSTAAIAADLHVTKGVVIRATRTLRFERRPSPIGNGLAGKYTVWSDDEVATMRRMNAAGATQRQVGDALGRSRQAVSEKATLEGLSFEHANPHPATPKERRVKAPHVSEHRSAVNGKARPHHAMIGHQPKYESEAHRAAIPAATARAASALSRAPVVWAKECQWMEGTRHAYVPCGRKSLRGSYCAEHAALCYLPKSAPRCEAA